MRKIITLIFIVFPLLGVADNYEISVTRKDSNLYKVSGKDIFIQTRYCYEYVYSESSFLKMHGATGEIIFLDSGGKCDVKAVYGPSDQEPGKYSITVSREEDNWYQVWGNSIYIKTSMCLNLALGEDAVLVLSGRGFGSMYIDGDECMVEGIYSQMKL